jgi:hypothetical protein
MAMRPWSSPKSVSEGDQKTLKKERSESPKYHRFLASSEKSLNERGEKHARDVKTNPNGVCPSKQ